MSLQDNIKEILTESPSVKLLTANNRNLIIPFFITEFLEREQVAVFDEKLRTQLGDYLEDKGIKEDAESDVSATDAYEIKAKKYISKWTNDGFLTNYEDEKGTVWYELSAHTHKTLNWLESLQKKEFVGAESKFKNIFDRLKELVEFTNDDKSKRLKVLQKRKKDVEKEIKRLKAGENVLVYEDYEIKSRLEEINRSAKELITDFKEVEVNFKDITKEIYRKHASQVLAKGDILEFTFDSLFALKESEQGRSFYAFRQFLMEKSAQNEWDILIKTLLQTLEYKGIKVQDTFFRKMKRPLFNASDKVAAANDRMAEKLSRIIRERENLQRAKIKTLIEEIKKNLHKIARAKASPDAEMVQEGRAQVHLPMERPLTLEKSQLAVFDSVPELSKNDVMHSLNLKKLLGQKSVNLEKLRRNIKRHLDQKPQDTLAHIITEAGKIELGLEEVLGYFHVLKDLNGIRYYFDKNLVEQLEYQELPKKQIIIPKIIVSKK